MRRTSILIMILFTSLATTAWAQGAQAHPAYSNISLQGSYGFLGDTWLSSPTDTPLAVIGIINFDGAGNLAISYTQNASGLVTTQLGTGTYSVANSGIGQMSFTTSSSGWIELVFVLDSAGKSFQWLLTSCSGCSDITDVYSGTAFAMGASSFSNASLKGSYAWDMEKWTSSQSPTAQCRLGTAIFDGVGDFTITGVVVTGGTAATFDESGTYSVNPNGSGVMNIISESGTVTLTIVVNSADAAGLGARGLQHMEIDSSNIGFVDVGTATKQ